MGDGSGGGGASASNWSLPLLPPCITKGHFKHRRNVFDSIITVSCFLLTYPKDIAVGHSRRPPLSRICTANSQASYSETHKFTERIKTIIEKQGGFTLFGLSVFVCFVLQQFFLCNPGCVQTPQVAEDDLEVQPLLLPPWWNDRRVLKLEHRALCMLCNCSTH